MQVAQAAVVALVSTRALMRLVLAQAWEAVVLEQLVPVLAEHVPVV